MHKFIFKWKVYALGSISIISSDVLYLYWQQNRVRLLLYSITQKAYDWATSHELIYIQ